MSDFSVRVDAYLKSPDSSDSFDDILLHAIKLNNEDALNQVIKLVKDDFGGGTYKWELKSTACATILNWKENGVHKLSQSINADDSFATFTTVIKFLACVAAGSAQSMLHVLFNYDAIKFLKLSSNKFKSDSIKIEAKTRLTEIVKGIEKKDKFPLSILNSLGHWSSEGAQEQVFAALVMRWFHLNPLSIEKYFQLINKLNVTEPQCHKFLYSNPYLIDPFYVKIWSKPRFGEKLQPDFVIQAIDNNYTIIEIEDPEKPILTKAGNLSAHTTHAKRQALEYREWIISNKLYSEKNFPALWRPNALVVIGMEGKLTEAQKERLRQENESTEGKLKVIGFDWIYHRAKATFENLLKYGFEQRRDL